MLNEVSMKRDAIPKVAFELRCHVIFWKQKKIKINLSLFNGFICVNIFLINFFFFYVDFFILREREREMRRDRERCRDRISSQPNARLELNNREIMT